MHARAFLERATLPALLVFAATLFALVLRHSMTQVDGDEAVIGVMAMNILGKGEHPLFFYGQPYGGGGALEAYLAAVLFAIGGPSSALLKCVALLLWLITIGVVFSLCDRHFDRATAVGASLLLIVTTPLVEWHLMVRGGYAGVVLGAAVILRYGADMLRTPVPEPRRFFVLGLISGVAYYNFELIVPLLVTLLVGSALHRERLWRRPSLIGGVAGFLIGASPVLVFNALHGLANFRYVYGQGSGGSRLDLLSRVVAVFGERLPRFFVGANVNNFVRVAPSQAYVEYGAYLVLVLACAVCVVLELRGGARAPRAESGVLVALRTASVGLQLEVLLLMYLGIFVTLQCVTKADASPRYLLPLFPALAVLAARGATRLARHRAPAAVAGAVLWVTLVACGASTHARYLGVMEASDRAHGVHVQKRRDARATVVAITRHLEAHGVTRMCADYWINWPVMLESRLRIIGTSSPIEPNSSADLLAFGPGRHRYPPHTELVATPPGAAAILVKGADKRLPSMLERPYMRGFPNRTRIGACWVMLRAPEQASNLTDPHQI